MHPTPRSAACARRLLSLALSLWAACESSSVTVTGAPPSERTPDVKVTYDDPWAAIEHGDFDSFAGREGLDDGQRAFVAALRSLEQGRFAEAEEAFAALAHGPDSRPVSGLSRLARFWVLFHEEDWGAIADEYGGEGAGSDLMPLVRAYAGSARGGITFTEPSAVLPLHVDDGLAFVDVEVGDRSCRFLLDTGATLSVIRADVAEAAGVAPVGEEAGFGTGTARTISVHAAVIPRLRLGNAILKNHPCIIARREDLEQKWLGLRVFHIEGVLGWNAIAKLDLEIDFRTSRATVRRPRLRSVERNMLWLRAPIVRCRLDGGMPILAGLDTGAEDSWLPEPFFNVIPEDARARLVGRTREASKTVWSVGGSERSQRKRVERLGVVLGGSMLEFRNLHSGRRWPSAIFVALLALGADVGRGGIIRIDATNGAFEIEIGK